ncbi:MAG: TlpA family protein disulfide reductase, partial [bacterium]|nr:TlpA family protein disulfide reductase [bacterium]
FPHLAEIFKAYDAEKFQILSINIQDQPGRIESDIEDEEMPYPILVGRRTRITRDLKVTSVPYLYIIDQKGVLKKANMFLQEDAIREVIDSLVETSKN